MLINSGDVVFVPAGARNSFAGILWVLWSVSAEGLALLDEVQFTGDPTVAGMSSHSLLANKHVIRGTWASQINAQKTLGEILNTMGVPVVVEQ